MSVDRRENTSEDKDLSSVRETIVQLSTYPDISSDEVIAAQGALDPKTLEPQLDLHLPDRRIDSTLTRIKKAQESGTMPKELAEKLIAKLEEQRQVNLKRPVSIIDKIRQTPEELARRLQVARSVMVYSWQGFDGFYKTTFPALTALSFYHTYSAISSLMAANYGNAEMMAGAAALAIGTSIVVVRRGYRSSIARLTGK